MLRPSFVMRVGSPSSCLLLHAARRHTLSHITAHLVLTAKICVKADHEPLDLNTVTNPLQTIHAFRTIGTLSDYILYAEKTRTLSHPMCLCVMCVLDCVHMQKDIHISVNVLNEVQLLTI